MSNYRPDPIYKDGSVEIIPLPEGCSVHVAKWWQGGQHDQFIGKSLSAMARATHAALTTQADEIDKLKAENAELRKALPDAERYRYARDVGPRTPYGPSIAVSPDFEWLHGESADKAIDAALGAQKV